jgi:hypothetical protein
VVVITTTPAPASLKPALMTAALPLDVRNRTYTRQVAGL